MISEKALKAIAIEATQIAQQQFNEARKVGKVEIEARVAARNDLLHFTQYTKPDYETNWHHEAICKVLNDVVRGLLPVTDPDYLLDAPNTG